MVGCDCVPLARSSRSSTEGLLEALLPLLLLLLQCCSRDSAVEPEPAIFTSGITLLLVYVVISLLLPLILPLLLLLPLLLDPA